MAGPQAAKLPIPHNRSFRPRSALRKPARKPSRQPGRERARKPAAGRPDPVTDIAPYGHTFVSPEVTRVVLSRPRGPRPAATPQAAKYG
jgi:hypothetical protein